MNERDAGSMYAERVQRGGLLPARLCTGSYTRLEGGNWDLVSMKSASLWTKLTKETCCFRPLEQALGAPWNRESRRR